MDEKALLESWASTPDVDEIMAFIRDRIEARRRGGVLYEDEVRSEASLWLSEILIERAASESSLHQQLDSLGDWRLQLHPNFTSHRGRIGRLGVWVKRRILLPPLRWLLEPVESNAWRQDRLNIKLLHLIEEMAWEIGRLKSRLARLEKSRTEASAKPDERDRP
jgi:septal ring factor EnvC (AmiA/AmiB activator)